ncbi:hypothetical protein ColLi_08242 [Colletotrichum liriopes]|uniref:Uncharacterized protein n=1 Tax=Colletotrichum liriopes TaxID=708192 RepID=A0AA37LUL3_9PEZI|nr:hypothetical protein ColLi_08242 [Colletotrichum liriopes]
MTASIDNKSLRGAPPSEEIFSIPRADDKDAPDQSTELEAFGEEALAIDPVIESRVLWKIDRFLMPAMVIERSDEGYGLVYYDKVSAQEGPIRLRT